MMLGEATHAIAVRQYTFWCLCLLLLSATQRKATRDKSKTKPKLRFDWFEFERSLDDGLFYNVHRMDKPSFYILLNLILPALKAKYKCHRNIRLSYNCMLSMT